MSIVAHFSPDAAAYGSSGAVTIGGLPFTATSRGSCYVVVQDADAAYGQVGGITAFIQEEPQIRVDLHGAITLAADDRVNLFAVYYTF